MNSCKINQENNQEINILFQCKFLSTIDDDNIKDDECKIFVGNVPYHCTQDEFDACFKDIIGFVKAEIVTMYKTSMSRGFGFVTMKNIYDAEILKRRDDIILKGRILRFTSYQNETYNSTNENCTNYVFVYGLPHGMNRKWLKEKFSNYEPIGKCFIAMNQNTGEMKNYGVIEILDDIKYKNILTKKWYDIEGNTVEISRYKNKSYSGVLNKKIDDLSKITYNKSCTKSNKIKFVSVTNKTQNSNKKELQNVFITKKIMI